MIESPEEDDQTPKPQSEEAIEQIRTEEPQAPFGADEPNANVASDETVYEQNPGEDADPGLGGYAGRDPKKDMPLIPSVEETQDDPKSHDAQPPGGKEHDVNN